MTNYNDGNWHNWSGGECPVNLETVVAVIWKGIGVMHENDNVTGVVRRAGYFQRDCWNNSTKSGSADISAFRVIKEHKEPREFWLAGGMVHGSMATAEKDCQLSRLDTSSIIHVREVLE